MKLIVASILILSLVILFVFALFPADISVSRVIRIGAPKDSVYSRIADMRQWPRWNGLLNTISPEGDGQMAESETDSLTARRGDVLVSLLPSLKDTVFTRFQQGNKSFNGEYVLTDDGPRATVVYWTLQFHLHWYPWEKLAGMYYNRQLGPVMESSLLNLQKTLENQAGDSH